MVQCGVDALLEGLNGTHTALLAGADDAEDDDLIRLFRAAAREVGVHLPTPEEERSWLIRRTEELERRGRAVYPRAPERVFDDRVYLVGRLLRESGATPPVDEFLNHLDKNPDDYQVWLDHLMELARHVEVEAHMGATKRVVADLTDVIRGRAFGATTQAHLDALSGLIAALASGEYKEWA